MQVQHSHEEMEAAGHTLIGYGDEFMGFASTLHGISGSVPTAIQGAAGMSIINHLEQSAQDLTKMAQVYIEKGENVLQISLMSREAEDDKARLFAA